MKINNVIICGLGALGQTYANKLQNKCNLKILVDTERLEKYKKQPPNFNGHNLNLDYITPNENFEADLIIISTKASGLDSAIEYINNFVTPKTIIISLINGISSEEIIAKKYPDNIIRSFFIGGSAIRHDNKVLQDGKGKIVIDKNHILEDFFNSAQIDYEVAEDIIYSQWVKLGVNIILNEPSAIYGLTVGELRKKDNYQNLVKELISEIKRVAQLCKVRNLENYEHDVLFSADLVSDYGKTSMLQDVLAKRKTEIDIFSGEIINLAKKMGIETPYNLEMYAKIKEIEGSY
ncbi:ketopantoate reductase family protein [bacterium]|nr:ketopantoate reductase family protein [bacterium]